MNKKPMKNTTFEEEVMKKAQNEFYKRLSNGKGCANDQGAWFYPLSDFEEILREALSAQREKFVESLGEEKPFPKSKDDGDIGYMSGYNDCLQELLEKWTDKRQTCPDCGGEGCEGRNPNCDGGWVK